MAAGLVRSSLLRSVTVGCSGVQSIVGEDLKIGSGPVGSARLSSGPIGSCLEPVWSGPVRSGRFLSVGYGRVGLDRVRSGP
ncbi:hypothetical protein HPP92_017069, partial [Vanilla planifolia]